MQFRMILDEESRKSIRELLFGEARGAAREEVRRSFDDEAKRTISNSLEGLLKSTYDLRLAIVEAVRGELKNPWPNNSMGKQFKQLISELINDTYKATIEKLVAEEVEKVVAAKLANKTVWEAKEQHDYIAGVTRAELKKALKDL